MRTRPINCKTGKSLLGYIARIVYSEFTQRLINRRYHDQQSHIEDNPKRHSPFSQTAHSIGGR
jgi:hypothetical protein